MYQPTHLRFFVFPSIQDHAGDADGARQAHGSPGVHHCTGEMRNTKYARKYALPMSPSLFVDSISTTAVVIIYFVWLLGRPVLHEFPQQQSLGYICMPPPPPLLLSVSSVHAVFVLNQYQCVLVPTERSVDLLVRV